MVDAISGSGSVPTSFGLMGAGYLTPDALMTYCSTRLRGLDDQINGIMTQQQQANDDSSVLSQLTGELDWGSDDLKVSGKADEDGTLKANAQHLLDAANKVEDPKVAGELKALAQKLVTVTGDPPNATMDASAPVALAAKTYKPEELKDLITTPVSGIQKDLNAGTELGMINLQSLMSQRQSAVQTVTNLVQALGDQMNKISANIGH